MGGQSVLHCRNGRITVLHGTNKVGEVYGRGISKAGRKRLLPGSGNLSMQIAEEGQFSSRRASVSAAIQISFIELRWKRLARFLRPINREFLSCARKHVDQFGIGRGGPRFLAARRESVVDGNRPEILGVGGRSENDIVI
ncbi:MAG: hypothetical protein ACRCW3_01435 [Metamycoplasmataceae bacterium]